MSDSVKTCRIVSWRHVRHIRLPGPLKSHKDVATWRHMKTYSIWPFKMHFCYVLDTNNIFATCTMHWQNIYLSKQSGIETFLAVAVRVTGCDGWRLYKLYHNTVGIPGIFLLLFALLVVGFNHIDMKHFSYSATELLSEEEGKVKVKGGELAWRLKLSSERSSWTLFNWKHRPIERYIEGTIGNNTTINHCSNKSTTRLYVNVVNFRV
jgi:hypothetical protein